MPFEFINNNTAIDSVARRRIRAHAATGKNASRTLTRPSKADALKGNAAVPFRVPEAIKKLQRDSNVNAEVERPVTDGLRFPVPIPAKSRGLVRQGMYHIARTYRIVQERLMSEEAPSNMTIAILVAMSEYERLQGQYARGYIHVRGLRRMVELRGGIKQFDSECCGVIQKVLRADLEYALQLGSRTLFGSEGIEFLRLCKGVRLTDGKHVELVTNPEVDLFLQKGLRASLWTIFSNMRSLAYLLNNAGVGYRQKLGAEEFHNTIMFLGHCLLHMSPLYANSEPDACFKLDMNPLEEVVHLGLTAFLVTFLRGLDHRIADKPLLSHRLRLAIKKSMSSVEGGEGSIIRGRVMIWTLFVGAVVVFNLSDNEWLIPTTNAAMIALGLSSWKDVKKALADFPWVDAVHDRTGMVLCNSQEFLGFSTQSDCLP
ncbi:hypothetical protein BDW66DRAFT_167549 [Aspergillus desertorum]